MLKGAARLRTTQRHARGLCNLRESIVKVCPLITVAMCSSLLMMMIGGSFSPPETGKRYSDAIGRSLAWLGGSLAAVSGSAVTGRGEVTNADNTRNKGNKGRRDGERKKKGKGNMNF